MPNWKTTALLMGCMATLTGCDWIDNLIAAIENDLSAQPAQAASADTSDWKFDSFPQRDRTYDGWAATGSAQFDELSTSQLLKLTEYVAMPQSHGAMVGILGYPHYEDGDYRYWKIAGGSNELAVRYNAETAIDYTIGH
ncbi:MAG: hypothetical protein AAGL08_13835 [Cyanobacteria bacterium J06573_11]